MRRIAGIDVARGLALLGMFVAHAAPPIFGGGLGPFLVEIPNERSRLLFAVAAGLGLGLLTGGTTPPASADARGVLRRQIAIRAFCLLLLGVALQATGVLVLVILDEYGIAFLLMLPLVFLPARVLAGAGAALLALAPGAAKALAVNVAGSSWLAIGPLGRLADWFITGGYPVFTWVAVLMLGVGAVRLGLRRPAVVAGAGLAGLVAMVLGLGASIALGGDGIVSAPIAPPYGGGPVTGAALMNVAVGTSAFTIGNVGFCFAFTMLLIGLTSTVFGLSRRAARGAATVLSPIGAAGAMPLSVYTAHLLVLLAATRETVGGGRTDNGWPVVIGLTVGALTLPWLWRRLVGRGPLEIAIGILSGRVRWRPARSPARSPDGSPAASGARRD